MPRTKGLYFEEGAPGGSTGLCSAPGLGAPRRSPGSESGLVAGAAAEQGPVQADRLCAVSEPWARLRAPCFAHWMSQGDKDPGFPGHFQFLHVPRTPPSPPVPGKSLGHCLPNSLNNRKRQ